MARQIPNESAGPAVTAQAGLRCGGSITIREGATPEEIDAALRVAAQEQAATTESTPPAAAEQERK